ncbi:MAG: hypothetical protein H0V18_13125 [Pyrinomonadaceae bacterium]|nr:hypothetical protein [Pyrinomonadaceae bacterium]
MSKPLHGLPLAVDTDFLAVVNPGHTRESSKTLTAGRFQFHFSVALGAQVLHFSSTCMTKEWVAPQG